MLLKYRAPNKTLFLIINSFSFYNGHEKHNLVKEFPVLKNHYVLLYKDCKMMGTNIVNNTIDKMATIVKAIL